MATIKESAQAYEPPQTHNIAELEKVPVNLDLLDGEGKDKDGEVFTYKYVVIENRHYRVPGSVLGGLKNLLKRMPQIEYFQVLADGEGLNRRYQVIPYVQTAQSSDSLPGGLKQ